MTTLAPVRADVPGPVARTHMTSEVRRQIGRQAGLWAWPTGHVHPQEAHR